MHGSEYDKVPEENSHANQSTVENGHALPKRTERDKCPGVSVKGQLEIKCEKVQLRKWLWTDYWSNKYGVVHHHLQSHHLLWLATLRLKPMRTTLLRTEDSDLDLDELGPNNIQRRRRPPPIEQSRQRKTCRIDPYPTTKAPPPMLPPRSRYPVPLRLHRYRPLRLHWPTIRRPPRRHLLPPNLRRPSPRLPHRIRCPCQLHRSNRGLWLWLMARRLRSGRRSDWLCMVFMIQRVKGVY